MNETPNDRHVHKVNLFGVPFILNNLFAELRIEQQEKTANLAMWKESDAFCHCKVRRLGNDP